MLRANQRLTGTGMMASMAPGLPFAIAGQLAYPSRQSVAVVGDGGFAMLMAELMTAVAHELPVRVVVLKNDSLAEVMFEQREIGNPNTDANFRQSILSPSLRLAVRMVFVASDLGKSDPPSRPC